MAGHLEEVTPVAKSKRDLFRPGQEVPQSGIYEERGPRGGTVPGGAEVTATKGEPFSPTASAGNTYRLKRATRHRDR